MSGIEALRADALAAAFDAFSIEVTLLAAGPFTSSKTVSGIWVQPVTDTDLGGFDLQSDRPSRILAVKRSEAEGINREARLQGPDGYGGAVRGFRVDAPVEIFSDHFRLTLVPDDTITSGAFSSAFSSAFNS